MKTKTKTKTGIIGFFDILGYQNLLENNEPENIIETVISSLEDSTARAKKEVLKLISKVKNTEKSSIQSLEEKVNMINSMIFSDTILLTMPDIEDETNPELGWILFLSVSIALNGLMFEAGLPLRGVINYGDYFIKDQFFAGRSIVKAYQTCNDIELSATVLTEEAAEKINGFNFGFFDQDGSFVVNYLIPTKSGETHMLTLAAHTYKISDADIKSQVLKSFWGNNKDITSSVWKKVENTENWLRYLRMKRTIEK